MMKKMKWFGLLFLMGVLSLAFIACDDDDKISFDKLPSQSQQFIDTYFRGVAVTKIEKRIGEPHYKVYLANGFVVKFYRAGGWQEVDGGSTEIPELLLIELLPETIPQYINEQFPAAKIIEISQHDFGYEVELNTVPETEVRFDHDGKVIINIID